jgi:hypothetical protein
MRRFLILCGAAAMLGLAGCGGSATQYAMESRAGGYNQEQIRPGIWRVSFFGNSYTTPETVQTFWLYRCAELALDNDADGFEIISDLHLAALRTGARDEAQRIPVHGGGGVIFVPIPNYTPDYDAIDSTKPVLEAEIRFLKRPFSAHAPKTFDAAKLKASLEPLVKGKLCDSGNVCHHAHGYLHV